MSASGLTLASVAGEQHQVVPHSRGVIGQREVQPELVEEGEARQGGVSSEGRVSEAVGSAEPGPGDADGCETNACPLVAGGESGPSLPRRLPKDGTIATHYRPGLPEPFSFLFSFITC